MKPEDEPLLRCLHCGWVHVGCPEPAPENCFRCGHGGFEQIDGEELRRTVPAGVTLQGLRWPPLRKQNLICPEYFSGGDELSALLLAMVITHCAGYSWDDEQAGLTSYLRAPHTSADHINSYGDIDNAAARTALAQQGLIEIDHQDGPSIWAKVTPEGHALLERLQFEQDRKAHR